MHLIYSVPAAAGAAGAAVAAAPAAAALVAAAPAAAVTDCGFATTIAFGRLSRLFAM